MSRRAATTSRSTATSYAHYQQDLLVENWSTTPTSGPRSTTPDRRIDLSGDPSPRAAFSTFFGVDLNEKVPCSKYGWKGADAVRFRQRRLQLGHLPESSFFIRRVGLRDSVRATFDLPEVITCSRCAVRSHRWAFLPRHLTVPTYEYDQTAHAWKLFQDALSDRRVAPRTYENVELGVTCGCGTPPFLASWYKADNNKPDVRPQISVSSGY